ncbi:MAG TPA: ankyrin repeat domain-containing protein [Dehalococcoidia bacterium]|nr:ankyrin repeat domain-containing protein [Dehalococcoidia bacterium]
MEPVPSLFKAVYDGDAQALAAMLGDDPSLARARNADTLSVLHFARFMGKAQILETLIAAGPPLDVFEAAALDRLQRVAELAGADRVLLAARSADGFTALHLASYYGAPDTARWLLENGADVNAMTENFLENMPIHAAAAGRHIDICALLLERSADVNARQHGGFTPLHTPAQHGDRAMVELFLERGADPEAKTDEGKTPADIASGQGNIEIAALIRAAAA